MFRRERFPGLHPMADGHKSAQLARPAAIARRPQNLFVGHFQVAFGMETQRCNGTVALRAPKEEHVREFTASHHNASYGRNRRAEPITVPLMTWLLKCKSLYHFLLSMAPPESAHPKGASKSHL
jgi:hypothetical protein